MSAARHTPAPWRVVKNWRGKLSIEGQDGRVANCPGGGNVNAAVAARGIANARLISAAPVMLDALKAIQSAMVNGTPAKWRDLQTVSAAINAAEKGA